MKERKDNSGALFRNDKKETDKHPDYTGSAMIDGSEYFLSAWLNESKHGVKYMSLSFKDKDYSGQPAKKEVFSDDIPF